MKPFGRDGGTRTPQAARSPRVVRPRLILLMLAAALAALVASGLWIWLKARRPPVKAHWDAVARARAYLRIGRPDRAFETVCDIHDEGPGAGEAMAIAGLSLVRFGSYRAARTTLERAIKLQPNQFDATLALAELNLGLGNGRRGAELLDQAARQRPGEFRVWLTLGKVRHDLGDLPGAVAAYEKASELKPADREALRGLIASLVLHFQSEPARKWTARALETYPEDPVILGLGARAAFDSNHLDEALALSERALAADRNNIHALHARASALVARSRWQEALPFAERATAVPNDRVAFQLLERIEMKLGLVERAARTKAQGDRAGERTRLLSELAVLAERQPEDPEIPWKMGKAAWEGGSFLLALRCFRAALTLDTNYEPARVSLEKLRRERPELESPTDFQIPGLAAEGAR
jgi:tetratricopeptide (TPR) repeat protein